MPSPFPGMDPYLETPPYWVDFHPAMILAMKGELQRRVPAGYSVWGDIHVWLDAPAPRKRLRKLKPDVFVTGAETDFAPGNLATIAAPSTSTLRAVRRTGNRYLKIKETKTERVVTVIELLSPANKRRGADHDDYLAKRNSYFADRINLVEIDLLRGGKRMHLGHPSPPDAPYYVMVCRGAEFPQTGIWPIALRDPLPVIPVPLDPDAGTIDLSLQACFAAAYEVGPYRKEIDYSRLLHPRLDAADLAWARKRVAVSPK
jgi:hypothetical protein